MKKVLLILLTIAVSATTLALSVLGVNSEELTEYGQVTVAPHYLATAPVQDGEVSDGEYGDAIHTLVYDPEDKTQYWNGLGESDTFKLADVLPKEAVLYMGYDAQYLYVAAVVKDENHYSPNEGLAVWDGDYFEMDLGFRFDGTVDGMLDRNRIAYGISGSGNPFGYAATVPNYAKFKVNEELPGYSVIRDDDEGTTVYEAALSWKDLTGKDEAPEKGFFMYQFGVAHSDYADLAVSNGTNAYLGCWRYAAKIPAGVAADDAKIGLHIFTIDKSVLPVETETSTEETTTQPETSTEETTTKPETTTMPETTTAPETTPTTADTTKDTTPAEESNPTVGIIIAVAAVLVVAIIVTAAVVILKGKKK